VKNIVLSENAFFQQEVNRIKSVLDKMTDICECSSLLDVNVLKALKEFLESHQNFIAKNIND